MRVYLAILSAKGCESILHRVFNYPLEIFRRSIWVTFASIYLHEQGSHIIKESIKAIPFFSNNIQPMPSPIELNAAKYYSNYSILNGYTVSIIFLVSCSLIPIKIEISFKIDYYTVKSHILGHALKPGSSLNLRTLQQLIGTLFFALLRACHFNLKRDSCYMPLKTKILEF